VLLVLALAFAGCRPTKLAGESIGQYRVTGTLEESSCGDGYPAPETSTFYVELRREPDSSYGYWKLPNAPLVAGLLDPSGSFRFTESQQVSGVEPDPVNGVVGCDLRRDEIVAGSLGSETDDAGQRADAGSDDASLIGTTTIRVTPIAGSDCSPLLLPAGGAFPVLPCELRYHLTGQALETPLF
jgi:hypothetical protein